jgi:hypothetical protein
MAKGVFHGYAYSLPTLSIPDVRYTLGFQQESGVWAKWTRIRGTGDTPTECWVSGVDYLLLQSVAYLLEAEWAHAHPESDEARARRLVDTGEYLTIAATEDPPRWLPRGGQRATRRRPRRHRHLRIIPKPPD